MVAPKSPLPQKVTPPPSYRTLVAVLGVIFFVETVIRTIIPQNITCITDSYCTASAPILALLHTTLILIIVVIFRVLPPLLLRFFAQNHNGPVLALGGVEVFLSGLMLLAYWAMEYHAAPYQYTILSSIFLCGIITIWRSAIAPPTRSPRSAENKILGILFFLSFALLLLTIPFSEG